MVRRSLLLALVLVAWFATSASAHTAVRRAEPGPGETVSGVVDRVVLEFLDPVVPTPDVVVRGPDGQPVPGLAPATMTAPDTVERTFDPLVDAGTYEVDYTFVATDGAQQSEAHQFRFEPGAADDGGRGARWWLALGAAAAAAVVVAGALRARRAGRADIVE